MNTEDRLSDGPSANIGTNVRPEVAWTKEMISHIEHSICFTVIEGGRWHWHLPMCIFFIWILVPIEILLYILVPSNAQMVRPTRVNVVAHIP